MHERRRTPPRRRARFGVRLSALAGHRPWLRVFAIAALAVGLVRGVPYVVDMHRAIPFPGTAEVLWYVPPVDQAAGAPLRIAAPHEGELNYTVRLDDWASGKPALIVPIRAGDVAEVVVPLGSYAITIARGRAWQGRERLFGGTGDVRKGTEPMDFYRNATGVVDRTINLTDRIDGNLPLRATFLGW